MHFKPRVKSNRQEMTELPGSRSRSRSFRSFSLPIVGISLAYILVLSSNTVSAFSAVSVRHRIPSSLQQQRMETTKQKMCICIDCSRVTNCEAYHFVETKHSQPHMAENPTFMPAEGSPTIHVNVRTVRSDEDRKKETNRMWSEHAAETEEAEAAAASDDSQEGPLIGKQKYDLSPVTTTEYDVVKCADFDEDKGCWIRNMPQEIKEANPDFVPS